MTTTSAILDPSTIVDRYVALWNEPDPVRRRLTITELFTEDAQHVLEAPEEMRSAARSLGFPTLTLAVRGHDELEFRVCTAYDEFVGSGNYRFRSRGTAARLGSIVQFGWEMVAVDAPYHPDAATDIAAAGLEIAILDSSDRIQIDHQFILS